MLTKDLIQTNIRNGKVFPKFIREQDQDAALEAGDVLSLFQGVVGRTLGDLEQDIKEQVSTPRGKGFAKLLLDDCEVEEPNDQIVERRWEFFSKSEHLRNLETGSLLEFQSTLAKEFSSDIASMQGVLFSDLPDERPIIKFEEKNPDQLIREYNLSHVCTLLCFATKVKFTLSDLTLAQKREVMRKMKFYRLMSEVDVDQKAQMMSLDLSGPLALFAKTQGYALRISNFFRFIASLPSWELEAEIKWKQKNLKLILDERSGVQSISSRSHGSYIPEEFAAVINDLNQDQDFKLNPGGDFLHLGRQSYCFPDMALTYKETAFLIELFHPWHRSQLLDRIESAKKSSVEHFLIGIDKSLAKDPEIQKKLQEPWFERFGFEFNQFPTPALLKKVVSKHVKP